MLRVVAICAVALGCHLIFAADSDIIDDDHRIKVTILPENETIAEEKEQKNTGFIDDDYPENDTFVKEFTTTQQEREPRDQSEEQDQTDIIHDDYLKNETLVEKFGNIQREREPRFHIEDENSTEQTFCLRPPDIEGVISPVLESEEHPLGTVITYQCKFGYVSRSSGTLLSICRIDRHSGKAEWTHPNTTCIPRSCGDPGYVINGRRVGNLFTFPNSIKFECVEGYKLQGLKERYCQASGEWSGRLPTCVQIYCPVPTNPQNGRVLYSSLDYGSELEYKCDKGFMLQNHQPRTCNEDGIWSNDKPECIETTCPIPESSEYVSVQLSENPPKVGTLAFYSCSDDDSTLVGASTSKCLSSGDWTFDPPECLRSCHVPEIQDGELGRNQWKNRFQQEFVSLREGQSVKHHELVTLRCRNGYFSRNGINGRLQEVECNDGTWSKPLYCHPGACNGLPPPVENAIPVIRSSEHGSTIYYRCDLGYGKEKIGKVTCQYAKWEGPTPACADHRCYMNELNYPGLRKPAKVFIKDGEHFNLDCMKAYKVASSLKKFVSCSKGKWDITTNPCIIKTCENEPPSIVNGQAREFKRVNGSVVDYECDDGYELEGHSTVHCAFGTWDGDLPVCKPSIRNLEITTERKTLENNYNLRSKNVSVTEIALNSTPNSTELKECFCTFDYRKDILVAYWRNLEIDSYHQIKKGERVQFFCRHPSTDIVWPSGLRFLERTDLICDRCQDWQIHDLPSCEPRDSGDSWIVYDINKPLKLLPGGKIEVLQSEKIFMRCINPWMQPHWHVTPTKALSVQYYPDSARETGYFMEDIIIGEKDYEHTRRFECFGMQGNVKMRPTVVDLIIAEFDILCPELLTETIQESFEIIYSNQRKVHSKAHYACKDPLKKLVGPNERVCLENGKWSRHYPACEDIRCPLLIEKNDFWITYSNNRKVNSEAFYLCKAARQRLIGSSNRTCLHSGEWSGSNPVCEDITCPEFPRYNGLTVTYSKGTKVGSIASFNCLNHATLIGTPDISCLHNGTWSHLKPSCEMLETRCPKLDRKRIFTIKYSNHRKVNSTAQFFCAEPNKKVAGCNFLTCQQNGEWSGDYPTCVDYVSCDLFATSPNLNIHYSDGGRVRSTASFQCLPPSSLIGNAYATCLSNGTWSHSLPICQPPNCSIEVLEESLPENLHINLENVTDMFVIPGSELPLVCEEHLVLTGRSKVLCNLNGKWEFADTQCISACRVIKAETSHLMVEPEKAYYRFGEFILLSCPPGLRLTSDVERMMCLGSTWSDPLPDCAELTEPNLSETTQTT